MSSLSLTPDQAAAVTDTRSRILLLAPAGSGKTEVLTRRIERVLRDSAGEAFRILAVTYTVKAADELRTRLKAVVAGEAWRVECETLHGFALDWLVRYGSAVSVVPGVIVFSDDVDRLNLLSGYFRSLGMNHEAESGELLRTALERIDACRTMSPGDPVSDEELKGTGIGLSELHDAYVAALSSAGGIDFPGMLSKLIEAFDVDPWTLKTFHRTYRHVLVDEGQDLTPAQAKLLDRLAGPEVSLFVVADDRQSINEYAGGSFKNAEQLIGPEGTTLRLAHNFRCAIAVLSAAERLHQGLLGTESVTYAPGAPQGTVQFESAGDAIEEAVLAEQWISRLLSDGLETAAIVPGEDPRVAPEDIAVIARTRWLLEPIVQQLTLTGKQVSLNLDASGFLTTREARIFLEALSVIADASDRTARRRFLEEVNADSREDIEPRFVDAQESPIEILRRSGVASWQDLANHLKDAQPSNADLDQVLGKLPENSMTARWSEDAAVLSRLWSLYRRETSVQQRTLRGYLRHVARSRLSKPTDPGIRIITIHRVKGLEFKAVGIVGVYDGALPYYRSQTKKQIDSERRSLYVAMTRAQRTLRVSWPRSTKDRWDRVHLQKPSRFLIDAGLVAPQSRQSPEV